MTNVPKTVGSGIWYDPNVAFGEGVELQHCSCVGLPCEDNNECAVGDRVLIGPFCTVSMGARLGDDVKLDPYCRVDDSSVGARTRLLYGARVHSEARVGADSLIGGNVPDRTEIGDRVKHFGRLVHIPRGTDWDGDMDPSPIIGDDVLIGANALLVGGVRVEDGAQIGAGATIIGDDVVIGRGAKIPPLSCVKRSVDPDSRFSGGPGSGQA